MRSVDAVRASDPRPLPASIATGGAAGSRRALCGTTITGHALSRMTRAEIELLEAGSALSQRQHAVAERFGAVPGPDTFTSRRDVAAFG